jgi:hypothetical protein
MIYPEHIEEQIPSFAESFEHATTSYWTNGKQVFYITYPIRGADPKTFRYFSGGFAKDRKHCYCQNKRLINGKSADFRALNYCYATDGIYVWTIAGKVKDADAGSFSVCDDGVHFLDANTIVPTGYSMDKSWVYFYDFSGKPKRVRKATPISFISLNDGQFAFDAKFVFCGAATIPKANIKAWSKLGGYSSRYSKDALNVFYFNWPIIDADYHSFEVLDIGSDYLQVAKDKYSNFWNDRRVTEDKFEKLTANIPPRE